MENKCQDKTLLIRGMNLKLPILCTLRPKFDFSVVFFFCFFCLFFFVVVVVFFFILSVLTSQNNVVSTLIQVFETSFQC